MGYVLMVGIVALIIQTLYLYLTTPIARMIKVPPIMPLIPYFPKLFGLESYFPSFPAMSFIISIIIVATVHEFSHGIFARRYGIKIKSTGFAFFKYFPLLFGAFVEQDDKQMKGKKKFEQMSVLSAGVFANVLTAIFFFIILSVFFFFAFTPSGITSNGYAYTSVAISTISSVNNIQLENPNFEKFINLLNKTGPNKIEAEGKKYVKAKFFTNTKEYVTLYYDAPAINIKLEKVISKINGEKIKSVDDLKEKILKYSPGEKITLSVLGDDGINYDKDIVLGENPKNKTLSWIGIEVSEKKSKRILGKIYSILNFKKPHVYYKSKNGDINQFIYDLLWWIIVINILVALFNMLPAWIFDGGMFWYLTIWGITKSEKSAKRIFSLMNWFILLIFIILMVKWAWVVLPSLLS